MRTFKVSGKLYTSSRFITQTFKSPPTSCYFSGFHSNHCKGSKFFHHHHTCKSKLSLKRWSQTNTGYLVYLAKVYLPKVYLLSHCLEWRFLTMGTNCSKNYFLEFYYHLACTCVDLICWTYLVFLKSPWCWIFCAQDLLIGTILSSIICVIISIIISCY